MALVYSTHRFKSPKFVSIVKEAFKFFSNTPAHELPPPSMFYGPGVYGLYYIGDYELYAPIARESRIHIFYNKGHRNLEIISFSSMRQHKTAPKEKRDAA